MKKSPENMDKAKLAITRFTKFPIFGARASISINEMNKSPLLPVKPLGAQGLEFCIPFVSQGFLHT